MPEEVEVEVVEVEGVEQELVELVVLQPGDQNDPLHHHRLHPKISVVVP